MKVDIDDDNSKLIDIFIGLKRSELDTLISALQKLKRGQDHFHFRSIGEIESGVSDVEIYCIEEDSKDNMRIDDSPIIEPNR